MQGNFIKRWDKASDINDAGWHHIQESCNERRRSSGGYLWRYDDMEEMIGEIWRSIPYDEFTNWFASNKGSIKRPNGQITSGYVHNDYYTTSSKKKAFRVHRLILSSFEGRKDEMQVNHKDGNSMNNNIENLEYMTQQQNVVHAIETGLKDITKVKTRQVKSIDKNGVETFYNSIKEASEVFGLNNSTISMVCSGKRQYAAGLRWEYIKDIRPYLL